MTKTYTNYKKMHFVHFNILMIIVNQTFILYVLSFFLTVNHRIFAHSEQNDCYNINTILSHDVFI